MRGTILTDKIDHIGNIDELIGSGSPPCRIVLITREDFHHGNYSVSWRIQITLRGLGFTWS